MLTRGRWWWVTLACLVLGFVPACVPSVTSWSGHLSAGEEAAQQGHYADAEKQLVAALREAEGFGSHDVRLAVSLVTLGELYYVQGKYADAETLYQRTQATLEKAFLADPPPNTTTGQELLRTVMRLEHDRARLSADQSRYAEAETAYKRVLLWAETARGREHPDLAMPLNGLGALYLTQRRYTEAEPLLQRALAISEKAWGPEHHDVATSLDNLGVLYRLQGRYAEAEPLHKRALAIYEKARGSEHPDVAVALSNLAWVYLEQQRYTEAEPLFRRAVATFEKVLGPEHPGVAPALLNYATLLHKTNREGEALAMETHAKALATKKP